MILEIRVRTAEEEFMQIQHQWKRSKPGSIDQPQICARMDHKKANARQSKKEKKKEKIKEKEKISL